ncbi:MAG: methyltransferase, partial [Kofleriaceae bacterium]|nr:methyltransferase [Kofleriaceae bacterium]
MPSRSRREGIVTSERKELDWHEPSGWPDDAKRDRLIGDWHIYQRKGGHRTSTDDLIAAWYAVHRNPVAQTGRIGSYLDLGCGVGSVLLMVCHKLCPVRAVGVEAQEQSAAMSARAVAELPENDSVLSIVQSDFRDLDDEILSGGFDLITGSPPYFPLNAGVLPNDAQRRACRFEARGGVEAYLTTAAKALSDNGRFYIVHQTTWAERVLAGA